ncbi:MAG TPA: NUDIX hydrolase [Candidatus Binataceae bacterium]|nr:NUDIX hydrolase [Candidatus Binataceae bacterium]
MSSNRRSVLKLGVVDLGVESAALPNGLTLDLAVIRHPGAAAIVAIDDHGEVAMLEQWRHTIGGYLWEVPAGTRREGEAARVCAERELREEAGLGATRWEHLGTIVTIPSFCDERIELFLARGLIDSAQEHDPDEVIRVVRVPLGEALRMIRAGEITDAKTIVALYRAQEFLAA